jgi:hypothetical protein
MVHMVIYQLTRSGGGGGACPYLQMQDGQEQISPFMLADMHCELKGGGTVAPMSNTGWLRTYLCLFVRILCLLGHPG